MASFQSSQAIRILFLEALNEQMRQEALRIQTLATPRRFPWPRYIVSGLVCLVVWTCSWMH
ncbi:MAG: hypothetical protein R3C12_16940 [Planctomycetaceae bacterium]|nr:hypothetical protein [Planctomycetaceae bacterium]